MSRLVVVSNRVGPIRDSARAGGLAVALVDALRQMGGLWFGWSGRISPEGTYAPLSRETHGDIEIATLDLDDDDHAQFYGGYANRTLWPVFHYRLDIADFDRAFEAGYRRVNDRMAARLAPLIKPDDVIWVHDYHFIPFAAALRANDVSNPIGFFLHIPFPVPEVAAGIPNHESMLRALIAYDLVGFQTDRDRRAFERYLSEEAGATVSDGQVSAGGRTTTARAFPIGIDADTMARFAVEAQSADSVRRLKQISGDRTLVIGVDRIDYSKGLPQRFRAFGRLLEDYPETRRRVSYLQIAPPSREALDPYVDIRAELDSLSGNINGRFADVDWTPIRYLARAYQRRTLAGFYRNHRIGLVTPLRDGMNLVAKEYVAAQDPEDPGVLVLSRFAGAAEAMTDALIVNPYDLDGVVEALMKAVHMPLEERQQRWRRLHHGVVAADVAHWRDDFLAALRAAARH